MGVQQTELWVSMSAVQAARAPPNRSYPRCQHPHYDILGCAMRVRGSGRPKDKSTKSFWLLARGRQTCTEQER
jgi:hypothetical protein